MFYVSITGLRLKGGVQNAIRFWWHAIRSMRQARAAEGNISADVRTINGVRHTVSVWQDKKAMHAYIMNGPHLKAMQSFHNIATGKVLGFYAEKAPNWHDAHDLWVAQGKNILSKKKCK